MGRTALVLAMRLPAVEPDPAYACPDEFGEITTGICLNPGVPICLERVEDSMSGHFTHIAYAQFCKFHGLHCGCFGLVKRLQYRFLPMQAVLANVLRVVLVLSGKPLFRMPLPSGVARFTTA